MEKICCFSGHRKSSAKQFESSKIALTSFISSSIKNGYNYFISGLADGIDLIAANIIIKNKIHVPATKSPAKWRNRFI